MSFVKLARQSSSQTDLVWEGTADTQKNEVVIRYGKRGASLRMKVVPKACFTEFNAELELEYRATKKRETGYIDEIESGVSPQPAAPAVERPWATLYAAPTESFKQGRKAMVAIEREIAQSVMLAFDLEIPPEWLGRPRVIESSNDYALPMPLYALAVCRSGVIHLADDDDQEIQPIRYAESNGLVDLDPRVPSLLSEIGLISVRQAIASADEHLVEAEEGESDWFF